MYSQYESWAHRNKLYSLGDWYVLSLTARLTRPVMTSWFSRVVGEREHSIIVYRSKQVLRRDGAEYIVVYCWLCPGCWNGLVWKTVDQHDWTALYALPICCLLMSLFHWTLEVHVRSDLLISIIADVDLVSE